MPARDGYYELTFAQMRERVERHYKRVQSGPLDLDEQRELATIALSMIRCVEVLNAPIEIKDHGARWWKDRG
jgi:hypothetical protein